MKSIGEITYDEKKLLGQGAFGKVYEGKFRSEKVAVKKMKRLYESFNEAIIQDTLCCQHENITGIFEIENDMSHIYIAMEYCDGGSLGDFLSEIKSTENVIKYCLPQLCRGLSAMREKEIVHRDLKPENILLKFQENNDNLRLILKISDFGLSRFVFDGLNAETYAGTKVYMAPEVRCRESYNEKCDMWSTGVILFEMCTQSYPFKHLDDVKQKFKAKIELDFSKLSNNTISSNLIDLIKEHLKINPNERLSIHEMENHKYLEECRTHDFETDFVIDWYSKRNPKKNLKVQESGNFDTPIIIVLGSLLAALSAFLVIHNIRN